MNRIEHEFGIAAVEQADRRFFAQNPNRSYVLRKAFPIEVSDSWKAGMKPKNDEGIFVLVRKFDKDLQGRTFIHLTADTDPASWSEEEACGYYAELLRRRPNLRERDANCIAAAEEAALYASEASGPLQ